jgi:acyl-CoA thioester hydrolase
MEEAGVDMVVAEANVRYLSPLRFDEEFDLVLTVPRIGETSTTTAVAMERDGEVVAEVELRHVVIDLETHSKASIPESVRAGLEPYAPRS